MKEDTLFERSNKNGVSFDFYPLLKQKMDDFQRLSDVLL